MKSLWVVRCKRTCFCQHLPTSIQVSKKSFFSSSDMLQNITLKQNFFFIIAYFKSVEDIIKYFCESQWRTLVPSGTFKEELQSKKKKKKKRLPYLLQQVSSIAWNRGTCMPFCAIATGAGRATGGANARWLDRGCQSAGLADPKSADHLRSFLGEAEWRSDRGEEGDLVFLLNRNTDLSSPSQAIHHTARHTFNHLLVPDVKPFSASVISTVSVHIFYHWLLY